MILLQLEAAARRQLPPSFPGFFTGDSLGTGKQKAPVLSGALDLSNQKQKAD